MEGKVNPTFPKVKKNFFRLASMQLLSSKMKGTHKSRGASKEDLEAFRDRLRTLARRVGGRKALFGPAGVSEANFSRMLGAYPAIDNPSLFVVKALADAGGVTVDELIGSKEPAREATPYDNNPEYRRLIEALEATSTADRTEILQHAMWASRLAAADVGTSDEEPRQARRIQPAPSPEVARGSLYAPQTERNRNASTTKRPRKANVRS